MWFQGCTWKGNFKLELEWVFTFQMSDGGGGFDPLHEWNMSGISSASCGKYGEISIFVNIQHLSYKVIVNTVKGFFYTDDSPFLANLVVLVLLVSLLG